jgi:outer membrane biosynthesis protein TonB
MCFSSPKPPPPPAPDPIVEEQRAAAEEQRTATLETAQAEKSQNKQRRIQEQAIRSGGMAGFRSLISGSKGGGGFGRGLLG